MLIPKRWMFTSKIKAELLFMIHLASLSSSNHANITWVCQHSAGRQLFNSSLTCASARFKFKSKKWRTECQFKRSQRHKKQNLKCVKISLSFCKIWMHVNKSLNKCKILLRNKKFWISYSWNTEVKVFRCMISSAIKLAKKIFEVLFWRISKTFIKNKCHFNQASEQ